MGHDVEEMTAILTDTPNLRDEAVERDANLSAQLAGRFCREDAYRSELTAVKDDIAKTIVERADLRRSVDDLVAKVRAAFADLGGALQAVVESLDRSFADVAENVKAEMDQT